MKRVSILIVVIFCTIINITAQRSVTASQFIGDWTYESNGFESEGMKVEFSFKSDGTGKWRQEINEEFINGSLFIPYTYTIADSRISILLKPEATTGIFTKETKDACNESGVTEAQLIAMFRDQISSEMQEEHRFLTFSIISATDKIIKLESWDDDELVILKRK